MKNKTKEVLIFLAIWLLIFLIIISIYFVVKKSKNKILINKVIDTYTKNIELQKETTEKTKDDLTLKINGNTIIGVMKIDKINFEGLIYEGTDEETLKKGIGHFKKTTILNGNACFAGHNYKNYWAKLHTLKKGDSIFYISYLGKKEYEVFNIKIIDETDWSLLQPTEENLITLITCINDNQEKRLCVQAKEKNKEF